jgi:hypothetical protein
MEPDFYIADGIFLFIPDFAPEIVLSMALQAGA